MDNIKLAEETIKLLKDFIEVEKTLKKAITTIAQNNLSDLSIELVENIYEKVRTIKGE